MSRVFFSHAIGAARLPFAAAPSADILSSRHWEDLASAYRNGLLACGEQVVPILRPEIYHTEIAQRSCGVSAGDWHMVVKPIEHIRPFHGVANVFVSDWSFPTLSSQTGGISPFFDQVRLLNKAVAVACCTEAITTTLRAVGVARAVHVPPFRPTLTRLASPPSRPTGATCTVMAAVEANSLLRWHVPLIQGFALAQARDNRLRLVLAISGAGRRTAAAMRAELLAAADVEDSESTIIIQLAPIATALPEWQSQADFFLWEGRPFGLPLPLIDAALAGLPLIVSESAAAAVNLPSGAFIPLATRSHPVDPIDEPIVQILPLWHDAPDAQAVRDALLTAAKSDREDWASHTRRIGREMETRFGLEAFRSGLRRLADYLRTEPHDGC